MKKRAVAPMKAGSFRDSVAKTVRLLTRDSVTVHFRGFQPMVVVKGDKVVSMVLPELGDNASPELVEAMQGFLDHECGHIFFTPFKRAQDALKKLPQGERRMRQVFNNIIEDIRLEKLLPRDLPGTKDNLERMYDSVMDKFFGRSIQEALKEGADPERMMGACIVVGFRALAGQKAFQRYMDDNNLWQWMTPLTSRMPTIAKDLQEMETYSDVERIVQMILDAMDPSLKQRAENAMSQMPDLPEMNCGGASEEDENKGEPQDGESDDESDDESQGGDAGDEEGNSSEGDDADGGEGGAGDEEDDESADAEGSAGGDNPDKDKDSEGGKGHGDGSGEDDGSDEEGGQCSSDEDGGDDNGDGDSDAGEEDDTGKSSERDSEGKTNRSITDALKQLEPTQRKVLYLHKNKKRSVTRIAEKMQISEDEVKSLLGSARRNLAEIMTGSK